MAVRVLIVAACVLCPLRAAAELADQLRALDDTVPGVESGMLGEDLRKRIRAANGRNTREWRGIRSRDHWRRFRDAKLKRLRDSLGPFPQVPRKIDVRKSGTLAGDGYRIDNLVFRSRAGLWVTANLYKPARPTGSMPAVLICHSHHAPKEQTELQDMGMTLARRGCLVLVPDMLGHGERRQHPFARREDFPKPFRVGRQDYYFRYDMGMQMHLAGESLMGWFVWDLWRGVDVLLAQPGVDPKRTVLMGAVAGGGDPAAVAAALDERIEAAVVFNFGGPQPETTYPLRKDAPQTFNFAGGGSFESTRNLRRSAADGFLPWVIVAAVAPRRLVYAHEFSWDRRGDPVWGRLEKIWALRDAPDRLAGTHGRGVLRQRPPAATHCTNIGRAHRRSIYPLLKRWFRIPIGVEDEYSRPRKREELACMTPELIRQLKPRRLCDLLFAAAARRSAGKAPAKSRRMLRESWRRVLGDIDADAEPRARVLDEGKANVERIVLQVEPGIAVPMILLRPRKARKRPAPCVVALAQGGKRGFLRLRSSELAALLTAGMAVCLPDLRGTGQTKPEGSRERWDRMTAYAATELMLGHAMVGARLRDLRSVVRYLRGRSDIAAERIALWGDSLATPNPPDATFRIPRHMDGRPRWSEPLGGMLALLGALYDEKIAAVCVRGGLSDFQSVLAGPFVYIPPDVVVPGLLTAGDLPALAAALAPRPLRLEGLVDGLNRRRDDGAVRQVYRSAIDAYKRAGAAGRIAIDQKTSSVAAWLLDASASVPQQNTPGKPGR